MGYTTELYGKVGFDKPLTVAQKKELEDFAEARHGDTEADKGMPGYYCQWIPTEDGTGLAWDGNEKFYDYVEWLEYLIKTFLIPWGITCNGDVEWYGEESDDRGIIRVRNNKVKAYEATISYPEEETDE